MNHCSIGFLLLAATGMPATAHSLKYVEDQLRQDERYIQLMNQPAPRTDDGEQIRSVVTHLIDQSGTPLARHHDLKFDPTKLSIRARASASRWMRLELPHGRG